MRIKMPFRSLRAFSARELDWLVPGPMAQAITFRAFGAAKLNDSPSSSESVSEASRVSKGHTHSVAYRHQHVPRQFSESRVLASVVLP